LDMVPEGYSFSCFSKALCPYLVSFISHSILAAAALLSSTCLSDFTVAEMAYLTTSCRVHQQLYAI